MSHQAMPLQCTPHGLARACRPSRVRSLLIQAQAASTSSRRKEATETLDREPAASTDTTHLQVEPTPPTDPDHTANGSSTRTGNDIEIDSVLAKELSENGVLTVLDLTQPVARSSNRHGIFRLELGFDVAVVVAGFRSTRRTKIICTIGPKSCSTEMLATLAAGGMNVARLNMSHGNHEWHKSVIDRIRKLNADKGYALSDKMHMSTSQL